MFALSSIQVKKKILHVVFTAGFSQMGTNVYCQWHQSLHRLPSLEVPNGSPRPRVSCRVGVWKRPIWISQVYPGHLPSLKTFVKLI